MKKSAAAGLPGLFPYFGGKHFLRHTIREEIERIPHRLYAEVFVGAGHVFFSRERRPGIAEAINDNDGDIANIFRVLQRHPDEFRKLMRWQLSSVQDFERLKRVDPSTLTDIERAVRIYLLMRQRVCAPPTHPPFFGRKAATSAKPLFATPLEAIWERLQGVTIDRLDWRAFVDRWDSRQTLFYIDPPYEGNEHSYRGGFTAADHEALAGRLAQIRGRFVLSMNLSPRILKLYRGCNTRRLTQAIHARPGRDGRVLRNQGRRTELLIRGPAARRER